jgi:hypothetical protein
MSRIYSAILFTKRDEWNELTVEITFLLGNLIIYGYETSRNMLETSMIDSPYTHQIIIKKDYIHEFCLALRLKTNSRDKICDKLKEKFTGKLGLQLLSDFLKSHGVKFHEYIHDRTVD